MKRFQKGFTLIEISVALLALGLVLVAAVVFWQQSERQRVTVAQQAAQHQTRDALMGFMHAHYRLPCPAANTQGVESCSDGATPRQVGYVPWKTLGLPRPEAGQLRYGVYREPHATAPLDRDLAVAMDRMNPLRVRTPSPRPKNADAPNPNAPPIPSVAETLLGATWLGDSANPLNASCNASQSPPCTLGGTGATQLVDLCLALHTASDLATAPDGRLAVRANGTRRPAAFVIAAPGLLDRDGNGQAFDAGNAGASNTDPTFDAPSTSISVGSDDLVLSASAAEVFSGLHCGAALSAISHAHFNAATGAFVLERGYYDYRDQLFVAIRLAEADVAAAAAGFASATSALLDGAKEIVSATADTTMSAGARSFQIGLAIAATVAAGIAEVQAIAGIALAATSLADANQVHDDFATRTSAMTDLSISVNQNTLTGDAIGY